MLTGGGDMNEILKKRIEEAAGQRSFKYLSQNRIEELELGCHYEAGFIDGAEYALSHQFISVDEALPEPEEEVVLFNKNSIRHYEIGWLRKEKEYSKSKWAITNGFVEDEDITHWMPLPKFETK